MLTLEDFDSLGANDLQKDSLGAKYVQKGLDRLGAKDLQTKLDSLDANDLHKNWTVWVPKT